jgi:hypothetical protein
MKNVLNQSVEKRIKAVQSIRGLRQAASQRRGFDVLIDRNNRRPYVVSKGFSSYISDEQHEAILNFFNKIVDDLEAAAIADLQKKSCEVIEAIDEQVKRVVEGDCKEKPEG